MLTKGHELDGRYIIQREIGSGGFGAVYLAEDTRFGGNNQVAIKKILLNNEKTHAAFRQEADLLYNLNHVNLPKVSNCFQEGSASFIVMDYISGVDLAEKLKAGYKFSIAEVLEIAGNVLDALEYLHSFLIFHRDIKPHNIKVDETGRIFLLDFGTAKGSFDETTLTRRTTDQSITGYTPFYAPLEQILRVDTNSFLLLQTTESPLLESFLDNKTDARSDIYSLGATIYHLLTGFSPEKATATVRAHAVWSGKREPLPDCRTLNPQISAGLASIINRCLEILPDRRFQTAADLYQALKEEEQLKPAAGITEDKTVPISAEHIPIQMPEHTALPESETIQPSPAEAFPPTADLQPIHPTVAYTGGAQDDSIPAENEDADRADVLEPIESLFPNEPVRPGGSKAKFFILAGGLVLLFALVGVGGWFAWSNWNDEPTTPGGTTANANLGNTETNAESGGEKGPARVMDYSLLVQKMRDGKKYQEPFESSGQEIFESGYEFQMRFTAPDKGYLYVFAEGLNDTGEKIFNIIFPTPVRNDGKAEVEGEKSYETGWNEFGGRPGTENFWMIWSREKEDFLEDARDDAFESGTGELTDEDLKKRLKDYLEEGQKKKAEASKETADKLTKVSFTGDSAVYLIELEHR